MVITAGLVITAGSAAAIAAFQKANSTWQFVPGSVVRGDTFKATKGDVEKTIKICKYFFINLSSSSLVYCKKFC